MLLAIVWVVLFVIWAVGGVYVYSDNGAAYRVHHGFLLVILLGILGWMTFGGFRGLSLRADPPAGRWARQTAPMNCARPLRAISRV